MKNLLEIVNDVNTMLGEDQVNSINATLRSLRVANLAKLVYEEVMNNKNWPDKQSLISFSTVGDSSRPTHILMDDNISEVHWIKYNKRKVADTNDRFEEVNYLSPEKFLVHVNGYDNSKTNVIPVTDFSGVQLFVRNDLAPAFYTSFDEKYIVFDSFNSAVDSTIQVSKIQAYGTVKSVFEIVDNFVPDIPEEVLPHYQAELRSVASVVLKQSANQKFEQESRRQRRWLSQHSWRAHSRQSYPNFGRKGRVPVKYPHPIKDNYD